jgi:hypothetical protein
VTYSTDQEPVPEGADLSAAPLDTPAPESSGTADAPEPAPIPTGFPEPAAEGSPVLSGVTVTETGVPTFPQPMPPAADGHVNLATVPPMTSLTVPPDAEGGETVVIDVYGTEVDDATAARAHAAAATAGFKLREL